MIGNELERFRKAQELDFSIALAEIRNGHKVSHWMWYIFPQIYGLGRSSTSQFYAIRDLEEARAYLQDKYLRNNLETICKALLELKTNDALTIFGRPDNMKLKSSMTLFAYISDETSIFHKVLEKYFDGKMDQRTIKILQRGIS